MPTRRIRRILVVRGGAIGDILMTTPALRGLRSHYPQAEIIVRTKYPELFDLNPSVNSAGRSTPLTGYDLYIWMKYEDVLPLREHIVDIFCRCAGVPPQERTLDLFFMAEEHRAILKRLSQFSQPVVTLQPWAGPWTSNKDWLQDRWERVVEELRTAYACTVIQLGTTEEPLVTGAVDWRGSTTLREAALTIKYASVHLGVNSSGQQFAHAVGTPAIVLYGTTHPVCSAYPNQICLYGGTTATPCYHRTPCEHRSAMETIQVSDVMEAIHRLLMNRRIMDRAASSIDVDRELALGT